MPFRLCSISFAIALISQFFADYNRIIQRCNLEFILNPIHQSHRQSHLLPIKLPASISSTKTISSRRTITPYNLATQATTRTILTAEFTQKKSPIHKMKFYPRENSKATPPTFKTMFGRKAHAVSLCAVRANCESEATNSKATLAMPMIIWGREEVVRKKLHFPRTRSSLKADSKMGVPMLATI